MDRSESYNGNGGPLSSEIPAGLYRSKVMIETVSYVYGLAGRDFRVEDAEGIVEDLRSLVEDGKEIEQFKYIGLRV